MSDSPTRSAAFFDLDGTLVQANIVHYFLYFAMKGRSLIWKTAFMSAFLPKVAYYVAADIVSRTYFNRIFYRNYRGMDAGRLRKEASELFEDFVRPRLFPEAVAEVRRHRLAGRPIVIVTGSLDLIAEPVRSHLDGERVMAVSIEERDGRLTGVLLSPPLGGEEKARAMRSLAASEDIDLSGSYAYGDSSADVPMLKAVGHPVAVNPRGELKKTALRWGWETRSWQVAPRPRSS